MMKKKNKLDHVSVAAAPVSNWEMFVRAVAAHVDPVLASMLFATEFVSFDQTQKIVRVATLKKFVLFQDLFIEQKKIYQEYLDRIFGFQTVLVVDFINIAESKKTVMSVNTIKKMEQPVLHKHETAKSLNVEQQRSLDVSDQKNGKLPMLYLSILGERLKKL